MDELKIAAKDVDKKTYNTRTVSFIAHVTLDNGCTMTTRGSRTLGLANSVLDLKCTAAATLAADLLRGYDASLRLNMGEMAVERHLLKCAQSNSAGPLHHVYGKLDHNMHNARGARVHHGETCGGQSGGCTGIWPIF